MFDDLHRLVDAVMLAGGSLSPCNTGSDLVTLGLARASPAWPALAWTLIELERSDPLLRMRLRVGERSIASKLAYKSRGIRFLSPFLRRWYPEPADPADASGSAAEGEARRAVTPAGVIVDEATMVLWLVSALASSGSEAGGVRLGAPRLSRDRAAELARQVRRFGWSVFVVPTARFYALQAAGPRGQRERLEAWLQARAPRSAWTPADAGDAGGDDSAGDRASMRAAIRAGLSRLTVPERRVLLLRHAEGMSTAEIAATMDLTEAQIEDLEASGRARLKTTIAMPALDEPALSG